MRATIKQIMEFFGYTNSARFSADWRALTDEEKEWFKVEVGATL